jgi:hypothetical protein
MSIDWIPGNGHDSPSPLRSPAASALGTTPDVKTMAIAKAMRERLVKLVSAGHAQAVG